jgi:putative SOS response-associated peptidase YedK
LVRARRQGFHEDSNAGIWDYKGGDEARPTLAILTTEAQDRVRPIHDRMPLVIPSEAIDSWLDGSTPPMPPAGTPIDADPISTRVNNVAHDDPEVLTPSRPSPAQAR